MFSFMLNSREKLQKFCIRRKIQGSESHVVPGHLVYKAEAGLWGQVEMGLMPGSMTRSSTARKNIWELLKP